MKATQQELIAQIALMEKKLHFHQMKAREHKKYFHCLIYNHPLLLGAAIVPAFAFGWKKGRNISGLGLLTNIMEIGTIAFISEVKRFMFKKVFPLLTK